ncbi:MAG TPA: ABC transporter ATP-binding protein [Candidatus Acidoferrales bacterium]|nr:ABC transporter ATP-binding protein [Candidatus Acidoferrales bacterium]
MLKLVAGSDGVRESIEAVAETSRPTGREGPLVRVADLRKVYGRGASERVVLAGVNLEIARGEWVAIIGPSGAGKSTLLQLVAALDTPSSGRVYFASRALDSLNEEQKAQYRRRSIGFVWQRHHLLADFTAAENVAAPLLLDGATRAEAFGRAKQALEQVGLADRAGQRAAELSGGERQRVAIARALVNRPELLLADEPTGELDEQNAEAVFRFIEQLHESQRLTTILATHNAALARRAGRVAALEHGVLGPAGVPAEAGNGVPEAGRRERG